MSTQREAFSAHRQYTDGIIKELQCFPSRGREPNRTSWSHALLKRVAQWDQGLRWGGVVLRPSWEKPFCPDRWGFSRLYCDHLGAWRVMRWLESGLDLGNAVISYDNRERCIAEEHEMVGNPFPMLRESGVPSQGHTENTHFSPLTVNPSLHQPKLRKTRRDQHVKWGAKEKRYRSKRRCLRYIHTWCARAQDMELNQSWLWVISTDTQSSSRREGQIQGHSLATIGQTRGPTRRARGRPAPKSCSNQSCGQLSD